MITLSKEQWIKLVFHSKSYPSVQRTPKCLSFFPKFININSNTFSFANVPTPPSVHYHVHVCQHFHKYFSKDFHLLSRRHSILTRRNVRLLKWHQMTDMQTSLPLLIVRPSILNPVIHFFTQLLTDKMKCLTSHTFALRIPFHLHSSTPSSKCRCNQCTNTIMNDMIHSISSHDLLGPSILTLPALYRCLDPSAPSLAQASPPRGPSLQSLDLPFSIATGPSSQALS